MDCCHCWAIHIMACVVVFRNSLNSREVTVYTPLFGPGNRQRHGAQTCREVRRNGGKYYNCVARWGYIRAFLLFLCLANSHSGYPSVRLIRLLVVGLCLKTCQLVHTAHISQASYYPYVAT
jgi:hypothetical protein